jgi:hypothetical protein
MIVTNSVQLHRAQVIIKKKKVYMNYFLKLKPSLTLFQFFE